MRRTFFCAGMLAITMSAAVAEAGTAGPTFEVASVKPSAPMVGNRLMVRMQGGPGSPDPGQITYTNVALKNVIMAAYNIKGYQVSGPGWIDNERFDIMAKIPKGATKEEFQQMLQNLLAERFKLKIHHESKEMPIMALVVGKNGPKLKESPKEEQPPQDTPGGGAAGPPDIKMGKDGMPQMRMPAGGRGMMMMATGAKMKMQAGRQSTGAIAEMLGNQLGRPVVDQTGLTGLYDYELEYAPDESMRMGGIPAAPPPDGGGGGAGAPESSGPTLMTAIQEQLGLRLESKRGPVDLVVIDSVEKVPTEN